MNVIEFFSWTFVLLRFNKNCNQPNFIKVWFVNDFTIFTTFCLSNRCVFDSFCYWFLIKFLKLSCLVLVLAIIGSVIQLILVKLLIVFIIIHQDAPLGFSSRANLYATGLWTRIIT